MERAQGPPPGRFWLFKGDRSGDEQGEGSAELDPSSRVSRRDALRCASCGAVICERRHRVEIDGRHLHRFVNPHGLFFEISCFGEASGAVVSGQPTERHTWFPGFAWSLASCGFCRIHLGWRFDSGSEQWFFGLIVERLIAGPFGIPRLGFNLVDVRDVAAIHQHHRKILINPLDTVLVGGEILKGAPYHQQRWLVGIVGMRERQIIDAPLAHPELKRGGLDGGTGIFLVANAHKCLAPFKIVLVVSTARNRQDGAVSFTPHSRHTRTIKSRVYACLCSKGFQFFTICLQA